jgi:hypothetical protein
MPQFTLKRMFVAITLLALVAWLAGLSFSAIKKQQGFQRARDKQMAAINKVQNFPPAGWTRHAWREATIAAYNVWFNVVHDADSTSPDEMSRLQAGLDKIVANMSAANSVESLDQIFALLLDVKVQSEPPHSSNCFHDRDLG